MLVRACVFVCVGYCVTFVCMCEHVRFVCMCWHEISVRISDYMFCFPQMDDKCNYRVAKHYEENPEAKKHNMLPYICGHKNAFKLVVHNALWKALRYIFWLMRKLRTMFTGVLGISSRHMHQFTFENCETQSPIVIGQNSGQT